MNTLEDIEKHYEEQIKAAGDDAEQIANLKTERADKVVEFRMSQLQTREREVWRKAALAKHPLAGEFPELIVGDSEEAIEKSAEAVHKRVAKLGATGNGNGRPAADDEDQKQLKRQARDAYGPVAGGGNGQAVQYEPADEKFLMDFQDRFNKGRQHPDFPSAAEVERFTRIRGSNHISERVGHWARQTRSNAFQ